MEVLSSRQAQVCQHQFAIGTNHRGVFLPSVYCNRNGTSEKAMPQATTLPSPVETFDNYF